MQNVQGVIDFIIAHSGAIAAALIFVINEIIAFSPSLESNSILQLILNGLKKIGGGSGNQLPPLK